MTLKEIIYGILILSVLLGLLFQPTIQRYFIYFPNTHTPDRKEFSAEDMQMVTLHTQDGLALQAWYHPSTDQKPLILYLPGNAGHRGYRMSRVRHFMTAGYGLLLIDYRGYGGNPGSPSEAGFYQDARAAMRFLQNKPYPIIVFGESIGTGVAIQIATEFPICALILQSPFTSMTALRQYFYPWLPIPLQDKYDSLHKIPNIHVPLLFLHGQADTIVPYQQGKILFEHANHPKEFLSYPNKGHNNLWEQAYLKTILAFIKRQNCLLER